MALVGRLALVTGGGSGIGRASCVALAREGASIIVADRRFNQVEETLKEINKNYPNNGHLGVDLDVAQYKSIKTALGKSLGKFSKPPTIVVNSAGITRDNFLLKLSETDFDEVVDVNLKGTFLVTQIFVNSIVEHGLSGASIINISSIVGKYGNMGQSNYSASKAAVVALTRTASKEFGKMGVRVNCILPGMIATPMVETVPDKVKEGFARMIPLGRFGKPEEVAEVIAFLASDRSSYINGAAIDVTGGF